MFRLTPDQFGKPLTQVVGGHQEMTVFLRRNSAGQLVEYRRHAGTQFRIAAQDTQVLVQARRSGMVIAGGHMHVAPDAVLFFPHYHAEFDVGFEPLHTVHHVGACFLKGLLHRDPALHRNAR